MGTRTIGDLAAFVSSKNAGPFLLEVDDRVELFPMEVFET